MRSLLLAPHNDDETLFAAYTLMREQPHVIVCIRARDNYHRREDETREAVYRLTGAPTYEQWTHSDRATEWAMLERAIEALAYEYDTIWAPADCSERNGWVTGKAPPPGWGVLQHDHIGYLARKVIPAERLRRYCLYTRWHGRDDRGTLVEPTGQEIARKLDALAQYETQIADETTRPWFYDRLDLREWVL